jgi:hypothetical protein
MFAWFASVAAWFAANYAAMGEQPPPPMYWSEQFNPPSWA